MSNRKEVPPNMKKTLAVNAKLLNDLSRTSLTTQARIYVKALLEGYVIKALEAQHEEMLANYAEDETETFVKKMLNSSAPVSAYDSIVRVAAPKRKVTNADSFAAYVSLGFTLNRRSCTCTKHESPDYCIFRKMSYWENRKVQKELLARGISE